MSLLLTSCTMGKQPDRLLNKGPGYLRTRTNMGMFAQNRKSAVELLAASKSQFYTIKGSVPLDKHQDLAVTHGQNQRFSIKGKQREPSRSKSEFDLSKIQLYKTEEESDENNNDTSTDSIVLTESVDTSPHPGDRLAAGNNGQPTQAHRDSLSKEVPLSLVKQESSVPSDAHPSPSVQETTLPVFAEKLTVSLESEGRSTQVKNTPEPVGKKPVPLPRKAREKPIPPPRPRLPKTPEAEAPNDNTFIQRQVFSEPSSCTWGNNSPEVSNGLITDTPKLKNKLPVTDATVNKKLSRVETLTQRFATLSEPSTVVAEEKISRPKTPVQLSDKCTYTATPVFIKSNLPQSFEARPVFISQSGICLKNSSQLESSSEGLLFKGRQQCSDFTDSFKSAKKEGLTLTKKDSIESETKSSSPVCKSEMSIESADQAVYNSEINACPSASMEAELVPGEEEEAREITRATSSLSGLMDPQDLSPLSLSPTPYCSSVPRSHSDISCRLEGQHSRDSSIVSSHSRLSRASAGADLENFFNQMGLEKGLLEPISRLKELQTSEVFDSMSSLDSHDAASICSTYSRSDQEWSETQSMERSHQQTSIIERNARIIKWLCNVRKAKNPAQKADSSASKD
ncbi:protein FAM110C-like [Physella acuta]|uniref:protein FAM110C-like n=1 Tax=Physella acuta TaxID=109671 RepID=UPI0027DBB42B|nr:protein FAM110C-like [Physella acuta]